MRSKTGGYTERLRRRRDERYRIDAEDPDRHEAEALHDLPRALLELLDRSGRLYERVRHLDKRMYVEQPEDEAPNPVLTQMDRLRGAFPGLEA